MLTPLAGIPGVGRRSAATITIVQADGGAEFASGFD